MVTALPENFRPLRRVEYDRLAALGVFEDERIELLDGVLVTMSPIGPRHSSAVDLLTLVLVRALGDRARVRVQNPFAASDISEPQPDLLLAPLRDYVEEHPSESYLVVEVAESSLAKDRGQKLRIYATRGDPEYWVVDVVSRYVEIYRDPSGGMYRSRRVASLEDGIELLCFPDVTVRVRDILR
jgi:Uma2 family endonuclease